MSTTATRKSFPVLFQKSATPRTFRARISTSGVDRDKDVINVAGWKLDAYKNNSIVLWQHRRDLPPIARCTDIRIVGQSLVAQMEFPPRDVSKLADEICGLMEAGFLHATSVGFIPIRSTYNAKRGGHDIHEAELVEFSIVNIPANSEALIQRCIGEGCDKSAMDRWLKSAGCGCHDLEALLATIDWPSPSIELEDEYEHVLVSPETVRRITREATQTTLRSALRASVRKEINYLRGRIDD